MLQGHGFFFNSSVSLSSFECSKFPLCNSPCYTLSLSDLRNPFLSSFLLLFDNFLIFDPFFLAFRQCAHSCFFLFLLQRLGNDYDWFSEQRVAQDSGLQEIQVDHGRCRLFPRCDYWLGRVNFRTTVTTSGESRPLVDFFRPVEITDHRCDHLWG